MGPLLFEPYAGHVAARAALLQPARVLDTAAGTGIVTRAVSEAVPQAEIVATDVHPAVLEFARQRVLSDRVSFQPADAQDLPFADRSFDLVLCQFGVMFIPDKVRANREARSIPAAIISSLPSTDLSSTRCRKRRGRLSLRSFRTIRLSTLPAGRNRQRRVHSPDADRRPPRPATHQVTVSARVRGDSEW